ncbi:MAG: DUF1643 domain-containing protein [Alistipes indistinctus]
MPANGPCPGRLSFHTRTDLREKMLFVIGLNPSTADESRPDRTVNRIMGFVEGGGYDGFAVFNLSAERSTDKWSLAPQLDADKHRRNLDAIRKVARTVPISRHSGGMGQRH